MCVACLQLPILCNFLTKLTNFTHILCKCNYFKDTKIPPNFITVRDCPKSVATTKTEFAIQAKLLDTNDSSRKGGGNAKKASVRISISLHIRASHKKNKPKGIFYFHDRRITFHSQWSLTVLQISPILAFPQPVLPRDSSQRLLFY